MHFTRDQRLKKAEIVNFINAGAIITECMKFARSVEILTAGRRGFAFAIVCEYHPAYFCAESMLRNIFAEIICDDLSKDAT